MSWRTAGGSGEQASRAPRPHAGRLLRTVAVSAVRRLFGATTAVLALAGCGLLADEPTSTAGDGRGYRIVLESPAAVHGDVCPDYRKNAGRAYYWDTLAFGSAIEAEIEYCQNFDLGSMGHWVVEERFDEQGDYSISAHLEAVSHSVLHDWRGIAPTLWVSCWHREEAPAGRQLDVSLWHFGPPQREYGEPTPVKYTFAGQRPSDVALWWGHPGQAEVLLLLPPMPEIVDQDADSHTFATQMRDAAMADGNDDSGPMLTVQTWEGDTLSPLGESQGKIEFDLVGLERAAFPVFVACGVSAVASST